MDYINMQHQRPSGDWEMNPQIQTSMAADGSSLLEPKSTGDLIQQGKTANALISEAKLNILRGVARG